MLLWRSAHFSGIGSATCPDASRRFVHRSGTGRIKSLVKLITSILILPSRANPIIGNIFPKSNSFLPGGPVEQGVKEGGEKMRRFDLLLIASYILGALIFLLLARLMRMIF